MWGRPKTLVLAAIVGSAALVPLFGDPRATPVTHPLWARLLLRALDLDEAVRTSPHASQVFAVLSWRDSLSLPADRYRRADGVVLADEARPRLLVAGSVAGEVSYTLAVAQPGDYQLRALLAGPAGPSATLEIAALQGPSEREVFVLPPPLARDWVFAGPVHLDPGAYSAQFLLPPGSSLDRIEVAPPCLNPIEPPGGWLATAVTTSSDLAVTVLKALDAEHELSPAGASIELAGTQFEIEGPLAESAQAGRRQNAPLAGGTRGLRAVARLDAPLAGLYSIAALGSPGTGQRWLLDACRKVVLCPGSASGWRPVLSQTLAAGQHQLALSLAPGAGVERVRIERRSSDPRDYVVAVERLGFDPGPPGPITRERALAAARFVADQRRGRLAALCGDQVVVEEPRLALVARTPQRPAEPVEPPAPPPLLPPAVPAEPPEDPIGPPLLPPQPPASPTLHGGA